MRGYSNLVDTDSTRPDGQWWKRDKRQLHASIFGTVKYIDEVQSAKRDLGLMNLQMYSARLASDFSAGNFRSGGPRS